MKVIGAGFSKTGTSTLRSALAMLEPQVVRPERVYHMETVVRQDDQLDAWHRLARRRTAKMDWASLLAAYDGAFDFPLCSYYEELSESFPDAKVILTVKDTDTWRRSWLSLLAMLNGMRPLRFVSRKMKKIAELVDGFGSDPRFRDLLDEQGCAAAYERHNAEVEQRVPSERLLVYRVEEGWEPLCKFFDRPVPDTPFPHRNARSPKEILLGILGMKP